MKLHYQVKQLKAEREALSEGIFDLMRYLNSSKFHEDTTVQAADVVRRLQEVINNCHDVNWQE